MALVDPCPCGRERAYLSCCGALHRGARPAGTPEELMRSRYSAFATGDADYLLRTWHPRTRPEDVVIDAGTRWVGLEVREALGTEVLFSAHYVDAHGPGELIERSRFAERAGRWFYVDGDILPG